MPDALIKLVATRPAGAKRDIGRTCVANYQVDLQLAFPARLLLQARAGRPTEAQVAVEVRPRASSRLNEDCETEMALVSEAVSSRGPGAISTSASSTPSSFEENRTSRLPKRS